MAQRSRNTWNGGWGGGGGGGGAAYVFTSFAQEWIFNYLFTGWKHQNLLLQLVIRTKCIYCMNTCGYN